MTAENQNKPQNLQPIFPVPFWMGIPSEDELFAIQTELSDAISDVIEKNRVELCSYVSFNTQDIDRAPGTKLSNLLSEYDLPLFTSFLSKSILDYVGSSQWRLPYEYYVKTNKEPQVGVNIHECWLNLSKKGAQQQVHCHPGSMISGVYYHKCNQDNAPIIFHNPNPLMRMGEFPEGLYNQMVTFINPQEGGLILFPSWLEHSTGKEKSDEDRYSVAFNCNVYMEIDDSETDFATNDNSGYVWTPS